MRVLVAVAILVLAALSAPAAAAELGPGGTFFDDDGNTHEGAIEALAAGGITRGCGAVDLYCPSEPVTRAQMAALITRALGLPGSSDDPFGDDDDSIFEPDIAALAAAGITRGCDEGRFCPDEPVSRAELAAFLTRAFSLPDPSANPFVDDDSSIFEADIAALAAAGITRGCNPPDNDRFCPRATVSRDQMASFLARALGLAQPEVPARPSVTIAFTGDVLIHSPVWRRAAANGAPYDFRPMLAPVADVIERTDLALCHLEVPLSDDNRDLSGYPTFNAPRQVADALAASGYDGCSTASNHSFDQGVGGITSTLSVLDDVGLKQAGMASRAEDAGRATIYDVAGTRVAHLSATWWLNGLRLPGDKPWLVQMLDVDDLLAQATQARAGGADVVVVSMHCCVEYQAAPTAYQRQVARELIASPDVDLVVGHHAHVVQPIQKVGSEYIVYGLGNFLSGQRLRPATQDGVIVVVEFALRAERWSARDLRAYPTWVEDRTYRVLPAARFNRASWRRTFDALTDGGASRIVVVG